MPELLKPTIHLNGDRPEVLREQFKDAYHAINQAIEALQKTCPDGRNFYPQGPGVILEARKQHDARRKALQQVADEMMELAVHCDGFAKD